MSVKVKKIEILSDNKAKVTFVVSSTGKVTKSVEVAESVKVTKPDNEWKSRCRMFIEAEAKAARSLLGRPLGLPQHDVCELEAVATQANSFRARMPWATGKPIP